MPYQRLSLFRGFPRPLHVLAQSQSRTAFIRRHYSGFPTPHNSTKFPAVWLGVGTALLLGGYELGHVVGRDRSFGSLGELVTSPTIPRKLLEKPPLYGSFMDMKKVCT